MPDLAAGPTDVDVAIAGGGLAGLTAGLELAEAWMSVAVLEKESILGGRARSWTDPVTGDPVHIGPHIFLTYYPNMLRLLAKLGTADRIVWHRGRFVTMVEGRRQIPWKWLPLPPPWHFVPSLVADRRLGPLDLLSLVPATWSALTMTEDDVLELDRIDARTFLESRGVSARMLEHVWSFIAMSILNVPLERCSAASLLRFYRRLIGHRVVRVGFPDGGLGDLFAPGAAAAILRAGGRVETGVEVRRVLEADGRAAGVETADGRRLTARWVVGALPPHLLARVLPEAWRERHPSLAALARFEPCPYVSVFLWFDRKLTRMQFWARTWAEGDLNCDFYDLSNIHRGWRDRPSVLASNIIYSGRAAGLDDDAIVARTIEELAEFLPAARRARVLHRVVNRIPMAIHCPYPGTEALRPPTASPVEGLLLAGDWVGTGLPASMEGAVYAGALAAESVLAEAGRPRRLAIPHDRLDGISGLFDRLARRFRAPRPRAVLPALALALAVLGCASRTPRAEPPQNPEALYQRARDALDAGNLVAWFHDLRAPESRPRELVRLLTEATQHVDRLVDPGRVREMSTDLRAILTRHQVPREIPAKIDRADEAAVHRYIYETSKDPVELVAALASWHRRWRAREIRFLRLVRLETDRSPPLMIVETSGDEALNRPDEVLVRTYELHRGGGAWYILRERPAVP